MPKQDVFTPQQAANAQRMDAQWNAEQAYNETVQIGPLEPVYNDITITPDMVHAMTPAQRNALRAAIQRQQLEDTVRDAVRDSITSLVSGLMGWK